MLYNNFTQRNKVKGVFIFQNESGLRKIRFTSFTPTDSGEYAAMSKRLAKIGYITPKKKSS